MTIRKISKRLISALGIVLLSAQALADHHGNKVTVQQASDRVRIEINGELFTEYFFKDVQKPYFHPVIGPTGDSVTRGYPMKHNPGEAKDHPHHTGLWFTHGDVNGFDFWHKTKIVHDHFKEIVTGKSKGGFTELNRWIDNEGNTVLLEERTFIIQGSNSPRILDISTKLTAAQEKVVFGDTKEGSMAIRLAASMRLEGDVAQGHIINSEGLKDGKTWGKRAKWVDYHGPVNGKTVGVAIFDNPDNPRYPTWWHVRPYGLFAANPFGIHDFEKKPAKTGDLPLKQGESVRFSYRFVFHEGDAAAANIEALYQDYTK